ncbi:hypothetical protein HPO96_08965 [Kribbella sandramycini]|uniref:Uncharacterized protein n=1 Tax=Kribbella sandramycini TaxID=60450 RepID=A0A7Y4KXD3_9ACTN|nr:hypothetical protein [Kribbella sandramycini]MBB6569799.1 hypothetical protein [Kribbella sandramycini]NOL40374.1 hypothetical protein [Kribbella sandramycini]
MLRLSLPARLLACLLMLATFLTVAQTAADAAVPDRKGWVLWNQTAGAVVPTGTWPAPSTVTPTGVGQYQVKLAGQAAPGGVVHVTAIHNAPHWCQAVNWFPSGADEIVNIRCYRAGGALDVTSFAAFFVSASGGPAPGPYGYVDSQPNGALVSQYNSTGAPNTSTPMGVGAYQVKFPGLVAGGTLDGSLQATAVNPQQGARCKIRNWVSSGAGQTVNVLCWNAAGAPLNTRFTLTYQYKVSLYGAAIPPKYYGYFLNLPPVGPASTNLNSVMGLGANTLMPAGLGLSLITFPRIAYTPNTVQVTAHGSNSHFCGLNTFWTNSTSGPDLYVRDVNCFTNAGAPVDTGFTVSANSIH